LFGGNIEYIPARPGEARITLADISKTTEHVGWQPKYKIEDYIKKVLQNKK